MKRVGARLFLLGLVVSCMIFPNSLKITSALALSGAAILGAGDYFKRARLEPVLFWWLLSLPVSVFYVIVGQLSGAPTEAAIQVVAIYGVFPLLWMISIRAALNLIAPGQMVDYLSFVGVLCCASVALFYYLFFTQGPDAVLFFIEEPNIDTETDGYIGATMYVFGTLIFILGGYLASFDFARARPTQYLVLAALVATAFISGRSALILSVFLGGAVNLLSVFIGSGRTNWFVLPRLIAAIAVLATVLLVGLSTFDISPQALLAPLQEKLATMGGEGRMQQFDALREGIRDHWGLGAGHGIGVHYTVSDAHPWRYEMVWVASIHRVGVLGAAIYAAPFVLTVARAGHLLFSGRLDREGLFLFGAFLCAFIASNTNPYIEALVFQWMYVLPVMYFLGRSRSRSDLGRNPEAVVSGLKHPQAQA